jgi:hypothetical protein
MRGRVGINANDPPNLPMKVTMNIDIFLTRAINRIFPRPSQARVRFGPPRRTSISMTAAFGGPLLRRGAPIFPWHHTEPQWIERGWQRSGNSYFGHYHAAGRRWRGMILQPYPGGYEAYIWRPPLGELERNTNHRPCFVRPQADGRFMIHFWEMPASLDHAVKCVEDVLKEAYHSLV